MQSVHSVSSGKLVRSEFAFVPSSEIFQSSVSDTLLADSKALFARNSVDDVHLGLVFGTDGKIFLLDPNVRTVTDCATFPY